MKIALIFTGVPRLSLDRTRKVIDNFREVFPSADCYFHTWENHVDKIPEENVLSCPQPELKYHPLIEPSIHPVDNPVYYEKVKDARQKKAMGRDPGRKVGVAHLQIYGYADALSKIPEDYDVYIRARYDVDISKVVNFKRYLKRATTEGPVGFSGGSAGVSEFVRGPCFDEFREQPKLIRDERWKCFLLDVMFFHKREHFDTDEVFRQFDEKQLKPMEFGWWSIMSAPYGGDIHTGVWGGVKIIR